MNKKPSPKAEELAQKLQEKLRRERPRWARWVPLIVVACLGLLAILAWVLYPPSDPPRLVVTALDVLAVHKEPAAVRAYLDPAEADVKGVNFAGLEYLFELTHPPQPEPPRRKAASDRQGRLNATFEALAAEKTTYHVRQGTVRKKQDAPDTAHIHAVAKDTPLLIVDAEETLADLDPTLWTKTNALNIPVRAGAAQALKAAQAGGKYALVYLAVGISPAKEYRRVRGWITIKALGPDSVPEGPVLGRLTYDSGTVSDARKAVLSDLRERFTGPMVAVVRDAEAAETCVALGIRAIAMGGGDFPAPVLQIKGWQDLPTALSK